MNINDVAKKTMGRIAKAQEKLDSLVAKRDEMITDYENKLSTLNAQIKEQEKEVSSLNTKAQEEKLRAANRLLAKKGITADQLLVAIANGDLYGIQEIMENGGTTADASEVSDDALTEDAGTDTDESVTESDTVSEVSESSNESGYNQEGDYNNYLGNGGY